MYHIFFLWFIAETARKILERDASLTRRTDDDGWSPLHYAVFFRDFVHSVSTVEVLLEHDVSAAYIIQRREQPFTWPPLEALGQQR